MAEAVFIPGFSYSTLARSGSFLNIPGTEVAEFFHLIFRNLSASVKHPALQQTALFQEEDREFVLGQAAATDAVQRFMGGAPPDEVLLAITYELFEREKQLILIKQNTIGPTAALVKRISDLLLREDELVVIGTAEGDLPVLLGMNTYQPETILTFASNSCTLDRMLTAGCTAEAELAVLKTGYCIRAMADFKRLYELLSKRESEVFCTQEFHEEFTRFFIDYRELL